MEWAVMCAAVIGWSQLWTETELEPFGLSFGLVEKLIQQEVKVIWQKAPHGGPFPG